MRAAQKAYFNSRKREDLIRSKDLERRVDKALEDGIVFDLDIERQPSLFEEEEGNAEEDTY